MGLIPLSFLNSGNNVIVMPSEIFAFNAGLLYNHRGQVQKTIWFRFNLNSKRHRGSSVSRPSYWVCIRLLRIEVCCCWAASAPLGCCASPRQEVAVLFPYSSNPYRPPKDCWTKRKQSYLSAVPSPSKSCHRRFLKNVFGRIRKLIDWIYQKVRVLIKSPLRFTKPLHKQLSVLFTFN